MKTKPEIKEKLVEAEKYQNSIVKEKRERLDGVVDALRWVLGVKITQEPKDPVTGK
jgi:hypothetical protein